MNDQPAEKPLTCSELLIVAVILAILSAILVPQYSRASVAAPSANMPAALQAMRRSINTYRAQHSDSLPPVFYSGAAIIDGVAINSDFDTSTINPLNGLSSICLIDRSAIDFADGSDLSNPGSGNRPSPEKVGWIVNTASGRLWATAADGRLMFNESDPFAAANFVVGK